MITDTLARLATLHPKLIDLSLARMERLLAKFDNPHLKLPPTFHVAGTNGKGSTCAFIRNILEAAGKRVHVYTSPHLVRFNERFRVAGQIIDDERLAEILEEVERVNAGEPITQFEITTIAGFLLFSRISADFLVLEVGLGGRLDATNVIPRHLMSVITPVSLDHQDYLGDTLALIAAEKAGIMKKNCPVILAPQEMQNALENHAYEKRAKPILAGQDFQIKNEYGRLIYQDEEGLLDLPPPSLMGEHQFINAGVAIAAVRHARLGISTQAIERGVTAATWPGRLQRLPLPQRHVYLDGAHNEAGGKVIAHEMGKLLKGKAMPFHMVVGMINSKDPTPFLAQFAPLKPQIYAMPFDYPAALAPEYIMLVADKLGLKAERVANLDAYLKREENKNALTLVTGSLYMAGEVLASFNNHVSP